ncbi:MAG: hypothetical protein M3Y27_25590, partial [Acidobacteriota bacterium]|nr:hypothetical protein [Acidobacteriota bacterium]
MNETKDKSSVRISGKVSVLVIVIAFAVALFATAASLPLRLDEILQIATLRFHSHSSLLTSVAQTPGAAPLNYLLQAAVLKTVGNSLITGRFVSIVFAIGALLAFWRLAVRCSIAWTLPALGLFALLPIHFIMAAAAKPYEQALFFLILSTIWFLRVSYSPTVKSAIIYSAFLLLCIYSEPFAFLPAIGYVLFFLRFINRKQERHAFWFLLPATVAPALLFLPYYVWAAQQVNQNWIYSNIPSGPVYFQALQAFAPIGSAGYIISALLLLSALVALGKSFRISAFPASDAIGLFSLAGGVVTTLVIVLLLDAADGSPVWPNHLFWVAPETIILFFAALGWLIEHKGVTRIVAGAIAAVLTLLCVAGDVVYLRSAKSTDLKKEADAIPHDLTRDSCVVFVSEGLSRFLFLVFQP